MRQVLVVIGGLPAVGKSTIATLLGSETSTPYLRVDRIEQAIVESSALSHPLGPAGYAVAHALAEEQLRLGLDVIVECVNPLSLTRDAWMRTATAAGAGILEVEVVCSDETEHRRRVEVRSSDVEGLMKPAWTAVMNREYEPWGRDRLVVDSTTTSPESAARLIAARMMSARQPAADFRCGSAAGSMAMGEGSPLICAAARGERLRSFTPPWSERHYPAAMSDASQQSDLAHHAAAEPWVSEPAYRDGAIDLLGILAYGALAAFDQLAEDARRAPTVADKVYVASLAALQIAHFEAVRARLAELDADVMAAMEPFHTPFNEFHAHTKPKDWLEGLVLAYVGNGFAADFYREVAAFVDADTRALVHQVLADEGHADFVVEKVRAAIAADRRVAGRLALWGRRLVGEALSQAQRVAAERDASDPAY